MKVIDLYAGAGLSSIGVASAGHEIIGAIELNINAAAAFCRNFPGAHVVSGRVLDYPHEWIGKADVVICGPPCQDDSLCNSKKGKRGSLKRQALRVARKLEAKYVIMEMVPGATSKGHVWWSYSWPRWAMSQGAVGIFHLTDWELGGYTSRKRTFALWAPGKTTELKFKKQALTDWGFLFPGASAIATEANSKAKRWRLEKKPNEPAPTVIAGGRALQVRRGNDTRRMTPEEQGRLQGFENLNLVGPQRDRQNQVGNGWSFSFGKAWGDWLKEIENAVRRAC